LPFAQRTLDAAHDCLRISGGEFGPAPIELVLGTRHELGLSWIVPMLPRLEELHPGLTTHLYFGSGSDLVGRVRAHQIDCAVTSSVIADDKLDAVVLHREDYVFVAAPSVLDEAPLRGPADAGRHTLIDVADGLPLFRYWRDAEGAFSGAAFGAVRKMGTIAAIRALVLRGEGVGVLPLYFVQGDLDDGRMVEPLPEIAAASDHFRLVFRGDDPRRELFESVAETMRSEPLK
jgi:LysR family transcriptional regulator, glycine cleavage system transcriptional activator